MNTVSAIDCIDHSAKNLADARELLASRVQKHNEECEAITRRLLPGIRSAAITAAQAHAELRDFIEANPDLFVKPRTMTLHGVKLGFQKGKGQTSWPDDSALCKLIRKHLGADADVYIQTIEVPNKDALQALEGDTLKKLGYMVSGTGDRVIIKDSTSEIDEIVARLLVEAAEPADKN